MHVAEPVNRSDAKSSRISSDMEVAEAKTRSLVAKIESSNVKALLKQKPRSVLARNACADGETPVGARNSVAVAQRDETLAGD